MKTITYKIIFTIVLVLTLIGMSADICVAEVGYNARLENPPSFVSTYFESSTRFSISLSSSNYAPLSRGWERSPTVVYSSSDSLSLRFNTVYYGRGTSAKKLIPVSVDAVPYSQGQRERRLLSKMRASSAQRMNAPQQGHRRRGLGITVPLPKRLDNIFGEGGAGLRVSGFRRITLSGRSQWTDAADNDLYRQNKFPSLAMEQVSKFDIGGTIGSKITVKVAQDNQTDIPLANRLQIRYKGDEDEILKTIEAGNTTLNLPNTKFVGYSSRIRGLFGIKVAAQLGGLKFTAIASQEKGSTEKATFSANGEEEATFIRDHEYVQRRIFDLGIPSDTLSDTSRALRPNDRIVRLLIYELEKRDEILEARDANLYVNPSDTSQYSAEMVKNAKVMKLDETTQFTFQQDATKNLHYVVFASSRTSSKDLGYYMEIERDGQTIKYGDITSDTLNLTLLYRADASPSQQTWGLMWRNCYKVPRGVDIEDIGLKIFKGLDGTERRTTNLDSQQPDGGIYLEILGLDQYKNGSLNDKLPDGLVDDRDDIFRKEWGLVIFPHRHPFASDTTFTDKGNVRTAPLADQVPSIYDYVSATEKNENSQYYLMLSTRTRSSIIRLKTANIIEGSEKVMLNGHQLVRGDDYTIQYDFGQITLLTSGANDPNAEISVDYEFAPFFAVQKKTLLGIRAEYEWSENFQFGTTVLYKSDKAQERKPRVGQETAKMMVLDFDASLNLKPRILTTLANALPFVTTDRPSNLKISGEIAQSRPNPNVDGVAYVDDFESAIEDLTLSTSRVTWQKSSRPLHADLSLQRGRTLWHAPRDVVQVGDVYDRQTAQGEGSLRTMRMVFRPNVKDTVLSEDSLSIVSIDDLVRPTWAGIMRYFGSRVDAKRAQLFEMRARTSENFQGRLHFDFGRINEDANGNGIPDSEDKYPEDGAASPEEDVGVFDGVPDHMEPLYDAATNTDPNGDNWYFLGAGKCPFPENECNQFENEQRWNNDDSLYYEWLNGTEGNRVDISVLGLPDEEALSSGGSELNDAYFSFYIDFNDPTNPFYWDSLDVEGTAKDSKVGDRIAGPWRTYRIPIRDSSIASTFISNEDLNPEWSQIKHVRVWWESASGQTITDTLEVANWYFVQSNWQDSVIYSPLSNPSADDATSLVVASISEDENPDFKSTPAEPYRDPTSNVTEPRRGLMLEYKNLHKGDTCIATKDLMVVDQYSGYQRIEMYAYSDLEEADAEKVKLFFRLGRDEENFYEQQIIIKPTASLVWDEANYINIDFNEITALKDQMLKAKATEISENGYRVKGNPNINEVRYFAVGLINEDADSIPSLQSGQIWLDELRVTDVRRDVGMAGRLSVSGTMADLVTFNFNYRSQDPYFRGLSTATRGGGDRNLGSGKTATSFGFSSTISLDKFFPRSWGARLPVTIGRTRSVTTPLLRTNSDIVLPEAVRKAEESISESSNFQISESFAKKGGNLLFNVLLNRLTTSFSYRRNLSRSVTRPYNFGENYNINSGFNFGIKKTP
ncbi:MAG: cell surface protein SprA, partial [candidate division Zixibacteria bacterium]|nr:cell surface protein SprA [candidate division Zixibacteria bacterium]